LVEKEERKGKRKKNIFYIFYFMMTKFQIIFGEKKGRSECRFYL